MAKIKVAIVLDADVAEALQEWAQEYFPEATYPLSSAVTYCFNKMENLPPDDDYFEEDED